MIVYDLRCGADHVFEAWFGSSRDYDTQQAQGLLLCPMCGDTRVTKAVMAPHVAPKANTSRAVAPMTEASPTRDHSTKAVLATLARAQAEFLAKATWVGADFAEHARDIDAGLAPATPIYGEATLAEAKALVAEGIDIAPLPFPVIPQQQVN